MTENAEIAQAYDLVGEKPMSTIEGTLKIPPPAADAPARVDETGVELKRGAFLNTIAMLASNFRGIFTFLVARLLGPAVLGLFSVAWATTDLISKIGIVGLDNAITTFIARSEAVGNRARIYGLNTIGLMRRGFTPEVIGKLKRAYRYLLTSRLNTSRALNKIEQDATLSCPEVQYLVDFIRNSQRGALLRRPARRAEEVVADE